MKKLLILTALLCLLGTVAGAETVEHLALKFGSGPREVGASSPDEAVEDFMGPTAFTVDKKGNIYVLDAPHFCVKIFAEDGELIRVVTYPSATPDERPVLGIDLAVNDSGELFVANATEGLVWKFNAKGEIKDVLGLKADGSSYFDLAHKLAEDSKGNVFVGEGMSMKVLKLGPSGKKETMLPATVYPPVLMPDDSLVMVKEGMGRSLIDLKLLAPNLKNVKRYARVKMEKPHMNAYAVGTDKKGHLYLFVVVGEAWDHYDAAYVLELDKKGKTVRKVQLPESPGMGMNRYLGIGYEGQILKVETDEENFKIVEYK